jgi:DNA-binding SARP family transcriptional activator
VEQSSSQGVESTVATARLSLELLGGFRLTQSDGAGIALAASGERVLAFVALHGRPVRRCVVAGSLWPDSSETRSSGSLRSALWRISESARCAVDASGPNLRLASEVAVDVDQLVEIAHDLGHGIAPPDAVSLIERFEHDLLPDWYDEWIVLHRERWRQIRLHALESLADVLRRAGDCATAAEAGLAALRADPLRETAHRVLIQTYLSEGNRPEALRQYRAYEMAMRDELGLPPSSEIAALAGVAPAC